MQRKVYKMKFHLDIPPELLAGAMRLGAVLGYEIGDGISVRAEQGERIGVSLKDNCAVIYYKERAHFFRGLGILCERAAKSAEFDVNEDGFFKTLSTMLDVSRGAVPTVTTVKRLLDYLAVMGYNMMLLYVEDTVKIEGRPYFGYMRGAYTVEELKEIDDYAFEYGVEIVPCIECYGHMEKYLIWPEASAVRDTASVMMAREEKTFELIEAIISTFTGALRSKRIHIGMDEAWDMGRGAFLDKYGYVPPFDIFNEFMERLIEITNRYGLRPMMWSDMYFRISNTENNGYYEEFIQIPDEVKAKIPKEVELVFWHYGEKHECDDYMLKKHNELDRPVIFAGGNWGWVGHFPENNYMMSTSRFSLNACRSNGVREAMFTIWTNDNAECDLFANLFGLSYFAELCYDESLTEEKARSRFEACTGGDYSLFYEMSYYHNDFENSNDYPSYSQRFFGKPLFWQDIMGGLFDSRLFEKKMSEHYAFAAKEYEGVSKDGKWGYLYDYAYRVFDYMAAKTYIAENLVPAYKSGDRQTLRKIAEQLLPELKEKTRLVHAAHKRVWRFNNNMIGWQNLDIRYGGVCARCDTAAELLCEYLAGGADRIEELDEPRLNKGIHGFIRYNNIATVNINI